jgi:RHS repeat-associated protein
VLERRIVSGENLYSNEFQRDKLGRIVEEIETLGGETRTWQYDYDLAGRLTEVRRNGTPVHLYDYDSNGNRSSHTGPAGTRTGTYDTQDRITEYDDATYTHTPAGERATKTTAEGTTEYDYDAAGNLREVVLPDGTTIEYLIDGRDRRIGKVVDGTLEKGWLYRDQLNPVAQLDGDDNVTHRFVYADKPNVPAYMVKDGTTYRIVSDHLGSVRLVIDTGTNEVVQRMDYNPFGTVTTDTNPGFQPFGFAGGLHDRDTGLVRFGARDYDPEIGRWTAKDPILFQGGDTNLYGYLVNDPINDIDVTGKGPVSAVVCGGVAAISKFSSAMAVVDAVEAANAAAAEIEGLRKAKAEQCQSPGDAELIEQRIQELKIQRSKEIAAAAAEGFEFTATVTVAAAVCGSIPFLP